MPEAFGHEVALLRSQQIGLGIGSLVSRSIHKHTQCYGALCTSINVTTHIQYALPVNTD